MPRPVAVLGGTFDPVHNAHLAVARCALEALGAARLLWLPTGRPPYREPPVAPAADRATMLRLVIAGEPRYGLDLRELAPQHSGYTVDTLRALRAEVGAAQPLVLVMGADQYAKLDAWKDPDELRRLCRIAVLARPGWAAPDGAAEAIPMNPSPISSSDVRARLARGADVAALVPAPVLDYIRAKGLYR